MYIDDNSCDSILTFLRVYFDSNSTGHYPNQIEIMSKNSPLSEIVRKSLEFMSGSLSQPITLETISKAMGYSVSWLETIFRRNTGQGMLAHLNRLRAERAKTLLRETDLEITEIALEVGFATRSGFFKIFKKETGAAPSAYRKAAILDQRTLTGKKEKAPDPSRLRTYRDEFQGTNIDRGWKVLTGEWLQDNGILRNRGGEARIALDRPMLPENFRLTFETRLALDNGIDPSDLYVLLWNSDLSKAYCEILVGCHLNEMGELRHRRARLQWNPRALINVNQWMAVELELRDDTVLFRLNGEEMFRFRDAFPPSYADRCKLVLGCWRGRIEFRKLAMEDLGFFPLVNAVRQGDAIFNSGSYKTAGEFYSRLLESGQGDTVELQFKIAECHLRQKLFLEAAEKLERVTGLPSTNFWAQNGNLSMLEINIATQDTESVIETARRLLANPQLRGRIRGLLYDERARQAANGFYRNLARLDELLFTMEEPGGVLQASAEMNLGSTLYSLRQYPSAEDHLSNVFAGAVEWKSQKIFAGFVLADVYAYHGRFMDSQKTVAALRDMVQSPDERARCDFYDALNLRGQGRFAESMAALEAVTENYPLQKYVGVLALLRKVLILCGLGDVSLARKTLEQARALYPESARFTEGQRSEFQYPLSLREGDFGKAADLLLADSRQNDFQLALRAEQMVKAGILFELGGEKEKAGEVWAEATRRFPANRVCFYGSLAEEFRRSKDDHLVEMEYPAATRSEMFHLAGLLYQSRGNDQRAKELFRMSVQDDPRKAWPAYLARQQLSGRGT